MVLFENFVKNVSQKAIQKQFYIYRDPQRVKDQVQIQS